MLNGKECDIVDDEIEDQKLQIQIIKKLIKMILKLIQTQKKKVIHI
jgi:hypothetical protein